MLYIVGELHQLKRPFKRILERNEWVEIISRKKDGKDTLVDLKDRFGNIHKNVNVKKLRKKHK